MPALLLSSHQLDLAAEMLRAGKLVAFPTETVYGLGGNALSPEAVARIFAAKERPAFDPLIVHLSEAAAVEPLVTEIPRTARLLMDRFWPGPLTLVLPKSFVVPDLVTSGLPAVAVRVPAHPLARELIRRCGVPLAGPSANPFGGISPTTAEHVLSQLSDRIDGVLDGGPCSVGIESTVLLISPFGPLRLLRPGGVTLEELQEVAGEVLLGMPAPAADDQPQSAPGMLTRHYAPRTPLKLVGSCDTVPAASGTAGLLAWGPIVDAGRFRHVEILSQRRDLTEAAAGLFASLQRLDACGADVIYAETFPEEGLGRALNDRLRRAAAAPPEGE